MRASTSKDTTPDGVASARLLLQRVSRSFYDVKQVIVLDQLIKKEAMRDDELAGRVGMAAKDVAKVIQRLVDDQLVSVHRRQELREGAFKAQQRTYYYSDLPHAVDIVKWKMYQMRESIEAGHRNEIESQGYVCPRCKKRFSTLDVGHLEISFSGLFACDNCSADLIDNEDALETKRNKERIKRFINQTREIVDGLKLVETMVIPQVKIEEWLEIHGPPEGRAAAERAAAASNRTTGVKIELTGDEDAALQDAKRLAAAEEKRMQNRLPSWIAKSTISGELTTAGLGEKRTGSSHDTGHVKPAIAAEADASEKATDFDAYYATLALSAEDYVQEESREFTEADQNHVIDDNSIAFERQPSAAISENGKRSRDEIDSGWGEVGSPDDERSKKARIGSADTAPIAMAAPTPASETPAAEEDEEPVDEPEEDPEVTVAGRTMKFSEVRDSEELQAEMTADEYEVFGEIFLRLG